MDQFDPEWDDEMEDWANFLVDQSWNNIDELAAIVVERIRETE